MARQIRHDPYEIAVEVLDVPNLRNDIAHGLVDSVGVGDAALLLHVARFLQLLRPKGTLPARPKRATTRHRVGLGAC